jgi:hypothetical protein
MGVRKELRPLQESLACDVCGRTILKGERTEAYLAPGGKRHEVCTLCFDRAQAYNWIRETAADETPTRLPREAPRRSLLSRLRLRRAEPSEAAPEPGAEPAAPAPAELVEPEPPLPEEPDWVEPEPAREPPAPPPRPRSRPKDPRHVRAVPTTAEVKIERALELFNGSEHQRTVAGLARTLGVPLVNASPDPDQASQVNLVVAWELSWYRYRVDLGDEADPVVLIEKGEEVKQIDESLQTWNGTLDTHGRILAEVVAAGGGETG